MSFIPSSIPLDRLFIFIMAGGSGERFWPLSRTRTPKHLLQLLGEKTLLEQTLRRFEGIVPPERIFVLTNSAQRETTLEAIPFHPQQNIIAEPAKRDTAPAAALATALALRQHPEALVALFPADAMIHDIETFRSQIMEAVAMAARNSALLTFSIKPSYPATGFGYLYLGEKISTNNKEKTFFRHVAKFVENPPLSKAQQFFTSGHHGWNGGMFLWQAISFLAECERQQPTLASFIKALAETPTPEEFIHQNFPTLPKISIDYAIMEQAKQVVAAIAEFDWDDVGSWTSLPKHLGIDAQGNTVRSSANSIIIHEAINNVVVSEGKMIALCGVQDLIIVQTGDSILICHRDAVEKIKQLPLPDNLK